MYPPLVVRRAAACPAIWTTGISPRAIAIRWYIAAMYHCALAVGAAGSFHSRICVQDAPLNIITTQSASARTNWIGWLITFTRTSMVTDDTRRIKYVSL